MISFQNVTKRYPKNKEASLAEVSFQIEKGEFVFLTGVSGSGKTTLLKLLYKAEVPTDGMIVMFDKNINKFKKKKLRRKMGIVFQDYLLLKDRNVYDNVAYPLACLGVNPFRVKKETMSALKKLNIEELAKKYPEELSGGQQQRVAIARALVNSPELLICDEPTGNLDSENTSIIMDHLRELNDSGMTIIMTTHNEEILNKENDRRVIHLHEGYITKDISNQTVEANEKVTIVEDGVTEGVFPLQLEDSPKETKREILQKMGWSKEKENYLRKTEGRK